VTDTAATHEVVEARLPGSDGWRDFGCCEQANARDGDDWDDFAKFANPRLNFARDLQDRLGILALLALSAPFRICKLQIQLAGQETDPVSGHHLGSIAYKVLFRSLPLVEAF
jgi:hypothetical protein